MKFMELDFKNKESLYKEKNETLRKKNEEVKKFYAASLRNVEVLQRKIEEYRVKERIKTFSR